MRVEPAKPIHAMLEFVIIPPEHKRLKKKIYTLLMDFDGEKN